MENKYEGLMTGCKRCPTCLHLPTVTMEPKVLNQLGEDTVLRCQMHGHVAQGDTVEMAVINWNKWISYVIAKAAEHAMSGIDGHFDTSYCTVCGDYTKTEDLPESMECARCHAVKAWKAQPKKKFGGMLAFLLLLALVGPARASAPVDMQVYADNAILNAAEHGYKHVTLVFGNADQTSIDEMAQELRHRGYRLDEELRVLNERVIRVNYLKPSRVAVAR